MEQKCINFARLNNKHLNLKRQKIAHKQEFSQKLDEVTTSKSQSRLKSLSAQSPARINTKQAQLQLPLSNDPYQVSSNLEHSAVKRNLNQKIKTHLHPQIAKSTLSQRDIESQNLPHQLKPYWNTIQEECKKRGVDPLLVASVIKQESNYDPHAISRHGAMGLMQIIPSTSRGLNLKDPFDPKQNIQAGIKYLSEMLNKFDGREDLALAAYNAGPGNVSKYGNQIPPFDETQNYVKKITKFKENLQVSGTFNRPNPKFA